MKSMPSARIAATSTGAEPGSAITASLRRSAPRSAAASKPSRGSPMIAACDPAAVTVARMLTSSDRAPDTEATEPRANPRCGNNSATNQDDSGDAQLIRQAAWPGRGSTARPVRPTWHAFGRVRAANLE